MEKYDHGNDGGRLRQVQNISGTASWHGMDEATVKLQQHAGWYMYGARCKRRTAEWE